MPPSLFRPAPSRKSASRAQDLGARVRLNIEDNGIGIDPRDGDKIFKMFVQLNEAAAYDGTGMGLAIVRKAVETMRGAVGIEAKEPPGSRFWVELIKALPSDTARAAGPLPDKSHE